MACKAQIDFLIFCYDDVLDWANYFKTRLPEFNTRVNSLEQYSETYHKCDCPGFMIILSPSSDLNGYKILPKLHTLNDVCSFGVVACCGREPQPEDAIFKGFREKPDDQLTFRITEDKNACSQYVKEIRKRLVKYKNTDNSHHEIPTKTPPLPPKPKKSVDNSNMKFVNPQAYDVPPVAVDFTTTLAKCLASPSRMMPTPTPPPRKTVQLTTTRTPDLTASPPPRKIVQLTTTRTPDLTASPEKPKTEEAVSIFPKEVRDGDDLIVLLKTDLATDDMQVCFENRKTDHRDKIFAVRLQKHVFRMTFKDLDMMPGLIHVEVYGGKEFLGLTCFTYLSTTESLARLLNKATNPVQLLTDSLGVDSGNRVTLDQCLAARLKARTPSKLSVVFKLKKENSLEHVNSTSELPTLLHLAASYGLPEVTRLLLRLPGSERALTIQNESGLTPPELAQTAGYEEVVAIIEDFQRKNCEDDAIYLSLIGKSTDLTASGMRKSVDLTATTINEEDTYQAFGLDTYQPFGLDTYQAFDTSHQTYEAFDTNYETYETVSFNRPDRSVPMRDAYDTSSGSRSNTLTDEDARRNEELLSRKAPLGPRISHDLYMTMEDREGTYMAMNNGLPPPPPPPQNSGLPDLRDQRLSELKNVLGIFHVDKNPLCEQYSSETVYSPMDVPDGSSDSQDPIRRDKPSPGGRPLPSVPDITSADFESSSESASNVSSPRESWNGSTGGKRPSLEEIMAYPERSGRDQDPRLRQQPSAMLELLEIQKDFKDGFSQQETLLRFEEWKRRYPETDKEEKKTFISVLRQRFGGGRRRKSASPSQVKEIACTQQGRPAEALAQSTLNIASGEGMDRTTRPDSCISTTSTTSGSRSSGISIGPGTSEDQQEEYVHVTLHRRFKNVGRMEPRQPDDDCSGQGVLKTFT